MRRFTLLCSALTLMAVSSKAQTVATFETLSLATADTYYVNYSAPGLDIGFNNGLAHFPCVYDTSYGGYWDHGFAFSNKTDTATSGYTNGYSAKYGAGFGGSAKYAVAYGSYNIVNLVNPAIGDSVQGVYVTNNTYAYNSMRDGDGYAKKFGDTTGTGITTGQGTAPDWYKVTIRAYSGGVLKSDSVDFYLADFRPAGTANDSIIKGWHWVNLLPLGGVDSLSFTLSSSDNGSFGMNTPAYFCIDNFTTNKSFLSVPQVQAVAAKAYPNPATHTLYVDLTDDNMKQLVVIDANGSVVSSAAIDAKHIEINTAALATGVYFLKLSGENTSAALRFVKQ